MGAAIERIAAGRGHRRVARIGSGDTLDREALGKAEVAFEFTRPDAAAGNVAALLDAGVAVVCGTTGWKSGGDVDTALERGGGALIVAPNFSPGVQLFFRLVRVAGELLRAPLYEPYVLESHHRGKRDAPSGTAERVAEILLGSRPELESRVDGNPQGPLAPGALQVASLRVGVEPGMHEVGFDGEYDRLLLRHSARGRDGFAFGAVLAAEWLAGKRGRHDFSAVLDDWLAARR
jgi:4-hydroxy-tetrahydrodipicolinate reductase